MAHFRRARWGVRRTFQTEQAIEELSVYDNVAMIHEHSKLSGGSRRRGRARARSRSSASRSVAEAKVAHAWRRATAAWSRSRARSWADPALVLLDEPAAGLPGRGDRAHGSR